MTDNTNLTVHTRFDHAVLDSEGSSLRFLVTTLHGESSASSTTVDKLPLNLALVIDASGSMGGAPLAACTEAVEGILAGLRPHDVFSLISFAQDVVIHCSQTPCSREAVGEIAASARRITTRGGTDLAHGWLAGAKQVAEQMERRDGMRNEVIVLSDGCANRGICDPSMLGRHAGELLTRGLISSCVGIGEHYSTAQLHAIAENGGGRLHHAAQPSEIVEVVLGELDDLRGTVADDVELHVNIPDGVVIEVPGIANTRVEGRKLTIGVGSLLASTPRDVVIACTVHPTRVSLPLVFEQRLEWKTPEERRARRRTLPAVDLVAANAADAVERERDVEAACRAARAWQSDSVRRVIDWNRRRLYADSRTYLAAQIPAFEAYCRDLPGVGHLVEELRRLNEIADRPWSETHRKELNTSHYKRSRGEHDKRSRHSDAR